MAFRARHRALSSFIARASQLGTVRMGRWSESRDNSGTATCRHNKTRHADVLVGRSIFVIPTLRSLPSRSLSCAILLSLAMVKARFSVQGPKWRITRSNENTKIYTLQVVNPCSFTGHDRGRTASVHFVRSRIKVRPLSLKLDDLAERPVGPSEPFENKTAASKQITP